MEIIRRHDLLYDELRRKPSKWTVDECEKVSKKVHGETIESVMKWNKKKSRKFRFDETMIKQAAEMTKEFVKNPTQWNCEEVHKRLGVGLEKVIIFNNKRCLKIGIITEE